MTEMPTWDDLTDLDKGAALLHLHKREWEGSTYAVENYPAEFFDHPALTGLDSVDASEYAATLRDHEAALSAGDHERLYNLALAEDRRRAMTELGR